MDQSLASPKAKFYTLVLGVFWSRFSYYGMLSLLVLYMITIFKDSDASSYAMYGAFIALGFSLPVLGGRIADVKLGHAVCAKMGLIFLIVGCLLLASLNKSLFYFGLSFLAMGVGFFKPCSASLLDSLFEKTSLGREKSFSLFYMSMNLGALLGIIVYGYIVYALGWSYAFYLSAVGLLLSLFILYRYFHSKMISVQKAFIYFIVFVCLAIILGLLLTKVSIFNIVYFVVMILLIAYFIMLVLKAEQALAKRLIVLLVMYCFIALFFSGTFQVSSSMILFIKRYINQSILGFYIPANAFASLYPFFVIVGSPILGIFFEKKYMKGVPIFTKIIIGLLLGCVGFFVLALSAHLAIMHRDFLAFFSIILATLLFGLGELLIMPPILSFTTRVVGTQLKATMVGVLFLFISFGGYISGFLSILFGAGKASHHLVQFGSVFTKFSIYLLVFVLIALLVALIIPKTLTAE